MQWMKMTNREIEQIASEIFEKYVPQRSNSHKQFSNIMKSENISFKEIPSDNANFVGALTYNNDGKCYIMVNQGIANIGRRNFTVAHELGHFFLNHKLHKPLFFCQDNQISEETQVTDNIEHEANYFASCLLMPKEKITKAFLGILKNSKKAKVKDFLLVNKSSFGVWNSIKNTFMKRYGVSEAALRYRLKDLGLADFEFEQ